MVKVGLVGLALIGALLRTRGLLANSFHADEALFATWARLIAVWRDPLLIGPAVDKPPLLFYAQALFYPLQGPVEWAARLPNWILSIPLVPLTGLVARQLAPRGSRGRAALLAAALVAFSPLAVQFSPTAFLDPFLTFWLVLAFYLAGRPQRAAGSGVAAGLALATKYQALLFFPLIFLHLLLSPPADGKWENRPRRWFAGMVAPVAAVLVWELARRGEWTLWQQQMGNFGGLRLIYSWELLPRLSGWLALWSGTLGVGWLLAVFGRNPFRQEPAEAGAHPMNRWLPLFLVAYLFFHWLLAIPLWERYLLPVVPLASVWLGVRAASSLPGRRERPFWRRTAVVGIGLLLVGQGLAARQARFPLGGSPAADDGAREIAAVLANAPYGTVLYDHWYSWHWRYHFFDRGVYVSWFPGPEALAVDLSVFGRSASPRFLALPAAPAAEPILRAVTGSGFAAKEAASAGSIILYQLEPIR